VTAPVLFREPCLFPGEGETVRFLQEADCTQLSMGAPDTWPDHLRAVMGICLASELPAFVAWGADHLLFHNDRFVPFLREQPAARVIGKPAQEALPEMWGALGAVLTRVRAAGKGVLTEDMPFHFGCNAHAETRYIRFSITPIFSPDGSRVDGTLCMIAAATVHFAGARHFDSLHESVLRENEQQLALHLTGMTRLQALSTWLVKTGDLHSLLAEILSASAELTGTDKGTIDFNDPATDRLEVVVHQGLGARFIAEFSPGQCAATARAAREGRRIIVRDVTEEPEFRDTADLARLMADGIRAMQSTPLVSRSGRLLGLLNNFFRVPHRPVEHELRLLDLLARMAADFIERSQAEQALRRGEEKLRRAMEIETVGIIFFDMSGAITDANDAFLRMSGYSRDDLEQGNLRWDNMTPAEWMPHTLRAVEEFKALGRTIPYEKQFIRKDGSRWWALFSATRLDDDEGVEFVIDITERIAADEELRRHRDDLEIRVQERTAALDAVNGALRDEIVERHRAEVARQELQRQLASAQEEERRRISRELHDQVGQHITALMLELKALESARAYPPNPATLASLQAITERAGKEIHDLALELRPTALDDLGLLRTLSNYIEQWSATSKIEVDFHSAGWAGERLPPPIETTAYRIVQEALTNVVKHAHATRVSLIVERRPEQVTIIIEDDGDGFELDAATHSPQGKRLGLLGMKERAALMDGDVKVESSLRKGTTIFVRLPLPDSNGAKSNG
jgi:PAS domain S-box-containing protein